MQSVERRSDTERRIRRNDLLRYHGSFATPAYGVPPTTTMSKRAFNSSFEEEMVRATGTFWSNNRFAVLRKYMIRYCAGGVVVTPGSARMEFPDSMISTWVRLPTNATELLQHVVFQPVISKEARSSSIIHRPGYSHRRTPVY